MATELSLMLLQQEGVQMHNGSRAAAAAAPSGTSQEHGRHGHMRRTAWSKPDGDSLSPSVQESSYHNLASGTRARLCMVGI